jgi:hypothetical protein
MSTPISFEARHLPWPARFWSAAAVELALGAGVALGPGVALGAGADGEGAGADGEGAVVCAIAVAASIAKATPERAIRRLIMKSSCQYPREAVWQGNGRAAFLFTLAPQKNLFGFQIVARASCRWRRHYRAEAHHLVSCLIPFGNT